MPTELIVIRHGETEWNQQGRWQGHADSPLTALGRAQAGAIADRLGSASWTALYSSDLGRAAATAEAIAARCGRPVTLETRLRERALGVFQGLTWDEIRTRHPADFARFAAKQVDHVIPGGESLLQKHERAVACMEQLAARHAGQRIVLVTHGGILDSLFRHALDIPLDRPRRWVLYNASLNVFQHRDAAWSLASWGDIAHLDSVGTLDDY